MTPPKRLMDWLEAFARVQIERPWIIVAVALISTIPALIATRGLGLKTDFSELLPDNKPSVIEMRRVSARLAAASTLTMAVEVPQSHPQALEGFAAAVVPKLQALGQEWVGTVDAGNLERLAFNQKNKFLYASLEDLRQVRDDVHERYDYEVQKAAGSDLGLDEPPPLTAESVREKINGANRKLEEKGSGYYIGEDGKLLAILIRTSVEPGSIERARELRKKVEAVVAAVNPARFDPEMKVGYTGDFITSVEEYESVKNDLSHVGVRGVLMVLAVIMLFFLRIRTLLAMGITIAIGLLWTFGAARLLVGYLNSSTGFLVSIVAGNGINFGIMYMARYLEARRVQRKTPGEAALVAHRETWIPTLSAALAASLSYGSLAATSFRGFKHFGLIGGVGMILCWVATYAFLPTILIVSEKASPMFLHPNARRTRIRGWYGYGFAWLVERFPRAITLLGIAFGLGSAVLCARYFANDPIEYDMSRLSNEHRKSSAAVMLWERVEPMIGRAGGDGMAIMVDRLDQVPPLKAELDRRRNAAPAGAKPFEQVVTYFDLLPGQQEQKIVLLNDVRDLLLRAHSRGMIGERDWNELAPYLPPEGLRPIGLDDLPEQMARPFTEKDGTRGRIVYIVPSNGRSVWDGKYLELWADSFRTTTLPNGEVIQGSGRAVIFADMLKAVAEDAPKAIALSFLGTVIVVLFTFGGRGPSWAVLGVLLLGFEGLIAFLAAKGTKLNFLNFMALPVTFGIGVDYAVNVMQRVRREGIGNMREIIVETGGAVVLCSLTTTLGYLSLMFSLNKAIVTFGTAAAVGEISCVLAAVLVLPAGLFWFGTRDVARGSGRPSAPPGASVQEGR